MSKDKLMNVGALVQLSPVLVKTDSLPPLFGMKQNYIPVVAFFVFQNWCSVWFSCNRFSPVIGAAYHPKWWHSQNILGCWQSQHCGGLCRYMSTCPCSQFFITVETHVHMFRVCIVWFQLAQQWAAIHCYCTGIYSGRLHTFHVLWYNRQISELGYCACPNLAHCKTLSTIVCISHNSLVHFRLS